MLQRLLSLVLIGLSLSACVSSVATRDTAEGNTAFTLTTIANAAQQYFEQYKNRDNLDAFIAHYAEDALLEDMVYGQRIQGRQALRNFYRWDDGSVRLLKDKTLVIEQQIVDGNTVITRGTFLPFQYHDQRLGPWRFVIWQSYNHQGLIVHQMDWINYTPKEMFLGGDDLNNP
ncbi:nuclear transport factor 2 family protein [Aestuariibacter halophilus]|uniref:Nuclear transport factor 2 family protein n=1 Tax=Fluctibacter halophilus TaxID=226011 RepID=A0ABS8G633_9ALTE|nr:nuclear transport factor 2 family protein [Aestuariibacter halophilus]MCC2615315.1 nuclear transport factor 2 family protein [Aestuariibacter halophilus]